MEHRLTVDAVGKRYDGKPVLQDVSFTADHTESVAIIGPSGAGKTTLLRIIAGAIDPDDGSVSLNGASVSRGDVAIAYQGDALVASKTAAQNVVIGHLDELSPWRKLIAPSLPDVDSPAVRKALDAVGLAEKAETRVSELSAGERSRVAVARAIVQSGPVLLADEPTANLDRSSRTRVLDELDSRAGGRVQIVVLHDVGTALERYDRVLGLRDGRLVISEDTDSVPTDAIDSLFDDGSEADTTETDGSSLERTTTDPPHWHV